jgi:hypothetical protein
MTRPQTIDRVALAIRKLTEALIAQDQRQIGGHETVITAQADLREALRAAFGMKEPAE